MLHLLLDQPQEKQKRHRVNIKLTTIGIDAVAYTYIGIFIKINICIPNKSLLIILSEKIFSGTA